VQRQVEIQGQAKYKDTRTVVQMSAVASMSLMTHHHWMWSMTELLMQNLTAFVGPVLAVPEALPYCAGE
jgi:hypothetical protein